jgi:predicted membrane channel-forming protein YqfA (hemolysin III family)
MDRFGSCGHLLLEAGGTADGFMNRMPAGGMAWLVAGGVSYTLGALIFLLDEKLITPEQRQRLVEHISRKFNIPAAEVEADIDGPGAPILDEDCTVTVHNPQKWF